MKATKTVLLAVVLESQRQRLRIVSAIALENREARIGERASWCIFVDEKCCVHDARCSSMRQCFRDDGWPRGGVRKGLVQPLFQISNTIRIEVQHYDPA